MKVVKGFKTEGQAGYNALPKEMQDKLIGLTLNAAIAAGLINDLGDGNGNFILHAEGNEDWRYTLVNGCRVTLSSKLTAMDFETEIKPALGNLTFGGGISTIPGEGLGKYWFNLGLPRTTVLVAETSSIASEELVAG